MSLTTFLYYFLDISLKAPARSLFKLRKNRSIDELPQNFPPRLITLFHSISPDVLTELYDGVMTALIRVKEQAI